MTLDADAQNRLEIQRQLRIKIGEVGYTPYQIWNMLVNLDFPADMYSVSRINTTARNNQLFVDVGGLGISRDRNNARYYVPKSKLQGIIDILHIACTIEDFERAAGDSGYMV